MLKLAVVLLMSYETTFMDAQAKYKSYLNANWRPSYVAIHK